MGGRGAAAVSWVVGWRRRLFFLGRLLRRSPDSTPRSLGSQPIFCRCSAPFHPEKSIFPAIFSRQIWRRPCSTLAQPLACARSATVPSPFHPKHAAGAVHFCSTPFCRYATQTPADDSAAPNGRTPKRAQDEEEDAQDEEEVQDGEEDAGRGRPRQARSKRSTKAGWMRRPKEDTQKSPRPGEGTLQQTSSAAAWRPEVGRVAMPNSGCVVGGEGKMDANTATGPSRGRWTSPE